MSVGTTATAFATMINAGSTDAQDCAVSLPTNSVDAAFFYQATDPLTNAAIGEANVPIDIAAGAAQSFVFGLTPQSAFAPVEVELGFSCASGGAANSIVGLNTLLLSASDGSVADVIALSATVGNNGIVEINPQSNAGAFSVASINVGSADTLQVSVDTGAASLPIQLSCLLYTSDAADE